MNGVNHIRILLLIVALLPTHLVAKTVRLGDCSGSEVSFKSAKKACKSGNFAGQKVVDCSNSGKQKGSRICNSDNERKGVYVDTCAGSATGFKNLKKACQSENHFGQLLVKCQNGEEKKRMQCEQADSGDNKTVIFKDNCGSSDTISGKNLKKACKNNTGQTLVKCEKKKNVWKEKKSMYCQGKKDRFKFKKCSPTERSTLISDYSVAEDRVEVVLNDLESQLENNNDMDKKLRNKMETVRKNLEKIRKAMDRPRTYVCKANKNLCNRSNAHTLASGKKVKMCDGYFDKSSQIERASIIVHEISHHKTQTNDKGTEHGGCTAPNLSLAANDFHKQAEYYEHIIECGLYIPN